MEGNGVKMIIPLSLVLDKNETEGKIKKVMLCCEEIFLRYRASHPPSTARVKP